MNRLVHQITAYLLLLCLLATVLPFNLLHHHEEEAVCDLKNPVLENDPCHISIYHSNDAKSHACNHETHIQNNQVECNFCKFFHSLRNQKYTTGTKFSVIHTPQILKATPNHTVAVFKTDFFRSISNRGPPAC